MFFSIFLVFSILSILYFLYFLLRLIHAYPALAPAAIITSVSGPVLVVWGGRGEGTKTRGCCPRTEGETATRG